MAGARSPRVKPNAWNRDGVILFGCSCGLDRASASGGTKAVYVRPRGARPGYLLWMESQTLQPRPIDIDTLRWRGDPISLAEGVAVAGTRV